MKPSQSKFSAVARAKARPFVLVNMAMTADGKIATANRKISSFTSPRDQEHLLALRATADAVMAGARTVDSDAVLMGPGPAKYRRRRIKNGLAEYNLRIIVTGSGTVNPKAAIFRHRFSPIIAITTKGIPKNRLNRLQQIADEVIQFGCRAIDFAAALQWLHAQWGVNRLLCEGGGELNNALFQADLVDELHLTIAPLIFGGRTAPTIAGGADHYALSQAKHFQLKSLRRYGDEVFLVFGQI